MSKRPKRHASGQCAKISISTLRKGQRDWDPGWGTAPQPSGGQSYRSLLQQSHPAQPCSGGQVWGLTHGGWSGLPISLSPLFVCPGFQSPTPTLSKTVARSPGRVLSDVLQDGFPLESANTHLPSVPTSK